MSKILVELSLPNSCSMKNSFPLTAIIFVIPYIAISLLIDYLSLTSNCLHYEIPDLRTSAFVNYSIANII
jgi:hypothetical protein